MSADDQPANVPAEVLAYLNDHDTLTLATASTTGVPRAATMVYVNDGITLYITTRPDTTITKHMEQNPSVAFAMSDFSADWSKMKGVQGSAEGQLVLSPSEISRVVALFKQKYSFLSDLRPTNLSVYRIAPTSIEYIDNERTDMDGEGGTFGIDYHHSMVYNIFRELPRHEVDAVTASLDSMQVNPGEVIVRQGAPADKFFIIADGEVEVVREDNGEARTIARLRQGQFFGEMAILRDMPRTATVKAVQPTTLLAMDRDGFRTLVAQSLGTTQDFDKVIQRRLDELGAPSGAR